MSPLEAAARGAFAIVVRGVSAITERQVFTIVGRRREGGQGIVEYGIILGGIAAVAIVILVFFGDVVAQVLDVIGNAIDSATT